MIFKRPYWVAHILAINAQIVTDYLEAQARAVDTFLMGASELPR
jgi:hypothetical protein